MAVDNADDGMIIALGGDDTSFSSMMSSAIRMVESAASSIIGSTTDMVSSTHNELGSASKSWEEYAQVIDQARDAHGKFAEESASLHVPTAPAAPVSGGKGGKAKGGKGGDDNGDWMSLITTAGEHLGDFAAEAHEVRLDKMAEDFVTTGKAVEGFEGAAKRLPGVLLELAPAAAAIHPAAGAAAQGLAFIGEAALPVTLALGTFAATLTATTYVISGQEGVMNILPNLYEGAKIALAELTLGYVDYRAGTVAAQEHEKSWANQMAQNQSLMQSIAQDRKQMFEGMKEDVKNLEDHSTKAEQKYMDALGNRSGFKTLKGEQQEGHRDQVHDEFQVARVKEMVDKLEEEAKVYKKTKDELLLMKLAAEDASSAEFARANAAIAHKKSIDATLEAEKKAKADAKERERETKKAAEDAKREQDKLVTEGERLHDSLKDPMEKLQDEAKRANELFKLGVISAEDLVRVMAKLEAGPKETKHKIKFVTEKDVGVESKEFGSVEYFASLEAQHQNFVSRIPKRDVAAADAAVRRQGLVPTARSIDGIPLTKEELETRKILDEQNARLATIATNTNPRNVIRIRPALLGSKS